MSFKIFRSIFKVQQKALSFSLYLFFSVTAVLLPNVHILPNITAAFHWFNTKSSYILNLMKNKQCLWRKFVATDVAYMSANGQIVDIRTSPSIR